MGDKRIGYGQDAREGIRKGIQALAKAVKSTLGPRGRNVVIERGFGAPLITKDGVTVAKEIEMENALENMGAQVVKEVASRANDVAGDGTTTATVLAEAIFEEGLQVVTAGANPIHIKRGIDKAVKVVLERVRELSQDVKTPEEIEAVGAIASNNDEEIGSKIALAMDKVGRDGSITVEEGSGLETDVSFVEGMEIDRGYLSPYFVTNMVTLEATLMNALILLVDGKLSSLKALVPILEQVGATKRPVLVMAEDIEGDALTGLVVNKVKGVIESCAVKAPGFGVRRKDMLEDLAALTGGTVITNDLGLSLDKIKLEHLGSAVKVVIKKDSTTIMQGGGTTEAIENRIEQIRNEIDVATSEWDVEKLTERLAKLSGGVAQIHVGAATESEMKQKKARVEDALHATRAASQEGIVPGGGVALLRSRSAIATLDLRGDEDRGAQIVFRALERPLFQIADNAGEKADVVVQRVQEGEGNFGFNADTLEYGDLVEQGVIDPTKVVCSTLSNAAGVASLLLATDAVVVNAPKDEASSNSGMPQGMPGMGGF
jgi:chaperonin GroEL